MVLFNQLFTRTGKLKKKYVHIILRFKIAFQQPFLITKEKKNINEKFSFNYVYVMKNTILSANLSFIG